MSTGEEIKLICASRAASSGPSIIGQHQHGLQVATRRGHLADAVHVTDEYARPGVSPLPSRTYCDPAAVIAALQIAVMVSVGGRCGGVEFRRKYETLPERTPMRSIPLPITERCRIIVVDDDEVLAMMLRYNIEAAGFAVELASDGVAALRAIIDRPPELVVLDWGIPGLSGIEVLRQVKCVRRAQVPVLMLTARTDADERRRALSLGADAFIGKPFSVGDVMVVIDQLLTHESTRLAAAVGAKSS